MKRLQEKDQFEYCWLRKAQFPNCWLGADQFLSCWLGKAQFLELLVRKAQFQKCWPEKKLAGRTTVFREKSQAIGYNIGPF